VSHDVLYPLLIDPEGQGIRWIICKERHIFDELHSCTSLSSPKLRESLKACLENGKLLAIQEI
jgi:hypothetical protein